MTRRTFEIILIILGIILGSVANIHGRIIPTRVSVISNQETQVQIKKGGSKYSDIEIGDLDILPIHYDGQFYHSDTLSMDNLVSGDNGQFFQNNYDISLTKQTDNAYLEVEFVVSGDDVINNSLRCRVKYKTNEWIINPNESILTEVPLSTDDVTITVTVWYELSDEDCSIDNINAAEGSTYEVKLYANVVE